jgi:hypothetical protein
LPISIILQRTSKTEPIDQPLSRSSDNRAVARSSLKGKHCRPTASEAHSGYPQQPGLEIGFAPQGWDALRLFFWNH